MPEGTSFSVLQVVTVPPKDEYTAEVVVLVTSLGARRKAFNSSRRAVDLLDIKGVPYRIVDLASRECLEGESKAIAQAAVHCVSLVKEGGEPILPQIFIDGKYIGTDVELQELEDEEQLTALLTRVSEISNTPPQRKKSVRWEGDSSSGPGASDRCEFQISSSDACRDAPSIPHEHEQLLWFGMPQHSDQDESSDDEVSQLMWKGGKEGNTSFDAEATDTGCSADVLVDSGSSLCGTETFSERFRYPLQSSEQALLERAERAEREVERLRNELRSVHQDLKHGQQALLRRSFWSEALSTELTQQLEDCCKQQQQALKRADEAATELEASRQALQKKAQDASTFSEQLAEELSSCKEAKDADGLVQRFMLGMTNMVLFNDAPPHVCSFEGNASNGEKSVTRADLDLAALQMQAKVRSLRERRKIADDAETIQKQLRTMSERFKRELKASRQSQLGLLKRATDAEAQVQKLSRDRAARSQRGSGWGPDRGDRDFVLLERFREAELRAERSEREAQQLSEELGSYGEAHRQALDRAEAVERENDLLQWDLSIAQRALQRRTYWCETLCEELARELEESFEDNAQALHRAEEATRALETSQQTLRTRAKDAEDFSAKLAKELQLAHQDTMFSDAALDIESDVLVHRFMTGISSMVGLSPGEDGLLKMFANRFKNVPNIMSDTQFSFREVDDVRRFLISPETYVSSTKQFSFSREEGDLRSSSGTNSMSVSAGDAAPEARGERVSNDTPNFGRSLASAERRLREISQLAGSDSGHDVGRLISESPSQSRDGSCSPAAFLFLTPRSVISSTVSSTDDLSCTGSTNSSGAIPLPVPSHIAWRRMPLPSDLATRTAQVMTAAKGPWAGRDERPDDSTEIVTQYSGSGSDESDGEEAVVPAKEFRRTVSWMARPWALGV